MGKDKEKQLRAWAVDVFQRLDPAGAPRIDFIGNSKTGEIWFNELNPIPGSYGYFLWEAAKKPVLFTEQLNDLLTEAQRFHKRKQIPHDPVQKDAQLLKRHLSE
jgi:D-alanine-D-alanine ligase